MPGLKDVLATTREGFVPAPDRPPLPSPAQLPGKSGFNPNPSIRCPLPPFNAGIDTLRQFDGDNGESPRRRVIPLPVQSQIGMGGTVNVSTTVISGGSGGGTTPNPLTAKTVSYVTPVLAPGTFATAALNMAKSFQLILFDANAKCEMRMYGSAFGQAADIGRALDSPVPAEVFNDLITDVAVDDTPFDWSWQNRVGVNTATPQTTQAYITVWNTDDVPAQININITFLPLEA